MCWFPVSLGLLVFQCFQVQLCDDVSDSCWNPLCYTEHHYRVWMQIVHSEMCWLRCLGWQEIAWLFFCCTCYLSTTCLFSWCQQMHLICVIIGKEGSLDILEDISIQNFFALSLNKGCYVKAVVLLTQQLNIWLCWLCFQNYRLDLVGYD